MPLEQLQDTNSLPTIAPHLSSSYPDYLSPVWDKDTQRAVVWQRLREHRKLASQSLKKINERYRALRQEQQTQVESRHEPSSRDIPDIDGYISQFEELARQAGYTKGNPEATQLFLSGLDRYTLEGVLRPPFAHGYQAIKKHTIESTRSTQLVHSIIGQPQEAIQSKAQATPETHTDITCFHCK